MADIYIIELEAELNRIFGELKSFCGEPDKYAAEILKLRTKVDNLSSQINAWRTTERKEQGQEYSQSDGVFLDKKEIAQRKVALDSDTTQISPKQPISPIKTVGIPSERQRKPSPYEVWRRKTQLRPISGEEWYHTEQVKALTGQDVPAGRTDLSNFLTKNGGKLPLTFSYLMVPDERDQSLNHFVSMHINATGTEITYLDSNGKQISAEDKELIGKHFPNANLVYRDHNGEKMSQADADKSPHKLLRVQFDNHNCGMYSTEFANLMNTAQGDENKIKMGIEKIKALDGQDQRQTHANRLRFGNDYKMTVLGKRKRRQEDEGPEPKRPRLH